MLVDLARCKVCNALYTYGPSSEERGILYALNPAGIVAADETDKGYLKLAPLVPLANLVSEKKGTQIAIKVNEVTVIYATAPSIPTKVADSKKVNIAPFWWVRTTPDESLANMRYASTKAEGLTITILQNSKKLAKHDKLLVYKAMKTKESLKGAVVKKDPVEDAEGGRQCDAA